MCGFCNVWVCVCMGFVMFGCVCGGFSNVWVCVSAGFVMCVGAFVGFVMCGRVWGIL